MSIEVTVIFSFISSLLGSSALTEYLISIFHEISQKKRLEESQKTKSFKNIVEEQKTIYMTSEKEAEIATEAAIEALDLTYISAKEIRFERMRQAKISFNAAISLMIIGVLIVFFGIFLLWFKENIQSGVITIFVGAVAEILSTIVFTFNKETNNRLDKIHNDLSAIEAAKVGLSIARQIEDPKKRDDAIFELSKNIGNQ